MSKTLLEIEACTAKLDGIGKHIQSLALCSGYRKMTVETNTPTEDDEEASVKAVVEVGYCSADIVVYPDRPAQHQVEIRLTRGTIDGGQKHGEVVSNWSNEMPEYFQDCAKGSLFLDQVKHNLSITLKNL